ncbi:PD-(D/E)XK nuclease family protein [Lunatimonas salinarum]|uniref:PD-(D/E)XK nuclease family protein n=1 Tax=Lunatimonas salinarum TaxID=1774590 RepID=UPI001AE01876|nr:PD-(D/E)XK nuclease family protein [Lunatimonas salinarum]
MERFLKDTAKQLVERYQSLKDITVVFPNRRAGIFFIKQLGELIDRPTWMPKVITIEDLFYDLAGQRPTDQLTLIFELFEVYASLHKNAEPFDRFYFWGELMLKDFNDVDQFMVDAKKLYHHLADLKVIEKDWSYLTEHQVALIRAFWKSFEGSDSKHQERFLKFWEVLYELYERFRSSLHVAGFAYPGMLYRRVAEHLEELPLPASQLVFVGFNAFTKTEEVLVKHFVEERGAEVFWDVDAYYLNDTAQEAGMFFRQYKTDRVLGPTFPAEAPDRIRTHPKTIKTYVTPLKVTQANLVGSILQQKLSQEAWEDTVVILPDEQLLFPVLNYLPETVESVNVTMGYSIKNTPVYIFLEAALELQRYVKREDDQVLFYHKPVTELLASVYLKQLNPDFCRRISEQIVLQNHVYVTADSLAQGGELFGLIFKAYCPASILEGLRQIMVQLSKQLKEEGLERSYLFQCYRQLTRLGEIFDSREDKIPSLELVLRIFRQLFRQIRVPFEGEPLRGLQVMGVLESRNLDFKRVIICDMNEGSFPPSGALNSMVPYNLRSAFGLPVQEQNDAVYSYTFYRLFHRAEEVHLIYTTSGGEGKPGEKSRYLLQLLEEMNAAPIVQHEEVVFVPVDVRKAVEICIPKNVAIMEVLERYVFSPERDNPVAFSPSAISNWLDCRLKFYFKYIAEIAEPEEVSEEVDAAVFGNLVHGALENLYLGFIARKSRRVLERDDFPGLRPFVGPAIELAIRKQYFLEEAQPVKFQGQLAIVRDVLHKYIIQVLKWDERSAPFQIISLEAGRKYRAQLELKVNGGIKRVALGGIIDRVDLHEEVIRLMDYKSGKDEKQFASIASLFDRADKKRNKAAMQTLFYGFLFKQNFPDNHRPLKPAILNLREIFKEDFNPYLVHVESRSNRREVQDYGEYSEEFEEGLRDVIGEIFHEALPFDQTEDVQKCAYCPYNSLCGR